MSSQSMNTDIAIFMNCLLALLEFKDGISPPARFVLLLEKIFVGLPCLYTNLLCKV